MAIILNEISLNRVGYIGNEIFYLPAGIKLRVRENSTGDWVDRLDAKVPNGKQWKVRVDLNITETDA